MHESSSRSHSSNTGTRPAPIARSLDRRFQSKQQHTSQGSGEPGAKGEGMLLKLFNALYEALSEPAAVGFGAECLAVVVWSVLAGLGRALLYALRLEPYVPHALVFANPMLLQWFRRRRRASSRRGGGAGGANGGSSGSSQSNGGKLARARGLATSLIPRLVPNLPIRIAESLLGRTASLLVVIPAHFMGGIMGVAIARLLFAATGLTHLEPPTQALFPIMYESEGLLGWQMFVKEILVTGAFVLGFLVLPEVLAVNRRPACWAWLALLPLLRFRLPDQGPTFAPSLLYSLWFASRDTLGIDTIQYEHVFGPILGGFAAGVVMVQLFPDEPQWQPL